MRTIVIVILLMLFATEIGNADDSATFYPLLPPGPGWTQDSDAVWTFHGDYGSWALFTEDFGQSPTWMQERGYERLRPGWLLLRQVKYEDQTFGWFSAFLGFIVGGGLAYGICQTILGEMHDAVGKYTSSNNKLAQEAQTLRARMEDLLPIKVGDRFNLVIRHTGSKENIAVSVDRNGKIQVPDLGAIYVKGMPGDQLESFINLITAELSRFRAHWCKANAEQLTQALVQARQGFDERLQHLQDDVPEPGEWQKLHEHYRTNHLRAARHGRLLTAVAHGDPSGALQIDWKVIQPPPYPYRITIKEDDEAIGSEWAHEGRVNRFLEPGRDYTYSFEVREDTREKSPNLENDFSFVVSTPTHEQWSWTNKDANDGKRILAEIKERVTDIRNAEKEIDSMGLSDEEAEWAKAQFAARRMKTNTE